MEYLKLDDTKNVFTNQGKFNYKHTPIKVNDFLLFFIIKIGQIVIKVIGYMVR